MIIKNVFTLRLETTRLEFMLNQLKQWLALLGGVNIYCVYHGVFIEEREWWILFLNTFVAVNCILHIFEDWAE